MILPSSILIIRSAIFAISKLWVIIIIVCFNSLLDFFKSATISSLDLESKLPVGSSAKTIVGLVIRALPILVLCC